jgi:hypothetical protein
MFRASSESRLREELNDRGWDVESNFIVHHT